MTLQKESIKWAIEFLSRHSDGDIFPRIPEISAINEQSQGLVDALANKPMSATFLPQPCRRFIVPKEEFSYRQATQITSTGFDYIIGYHLSVWCGYRETSPAQRQGV